MWWWNAKDWWPLSDKIVSGVVTAAILGLLLATALLLIREFRKKARGPDGLLAERFAAGEITELEFRRGMQILRDELGPDAIAEPAEQSSG